MLCITIISLVWCIFDRTHTNRIRRFLRNYRVTHFSYLMRFCNIYCALRLLCDIGLLILLSSISSRACSIKLLIARDTTRIIRHCRPGGQLKLTKFRPFASPAIDRREFIQLIIDRHLIISSSDYAHNHVAIVNNWFDGIFKSLSSIKPTSPVWILNFAIRYYSSRLFCFIDCSREN